MYAALTSPYVLVPLSGLAGAGCFVAWQIRRRHMQRWLWSYLRQTARRHLPATDQEVHVLLCVADHFEPRDNGVSREAGMKRVQTWVDAYPRQFAGFRDSDGRTPRHTFFFPAEEYAPEYLDALADLCRQGFGEVEIHLHHDRDTAEGFRGKLTDFRDLLATRHGLLARHRQTGVLGYAFIHGNWALCNSGPNGANCGVDSELAILRETGCFVDMTFPSAPHPTQPPKTNVIYYGVDRPGQPRSHEQGWDIGTCPPPDKGLLLIPGPLLLDFGHAKWGVLPRLENSCLQQSQPPDARRIDNWLRARIQVPGRPDWYFVKLHCHGAPEESHEALLGRPMVDFHRALAERARTNPRFHYHYVTAREMYNLAKAAEAGYQGSVADALDHLFVSNLATFAAAQVQ